jgi:hypothetical protein
VLATPRRIERTDLPTPLQTVHPKSKWEVALGSTLSPMEKGAIGGTLEMGGGHKPMAARVLGIGVKTLYRRLAAYRLPEDQCGRIFLPPSPLLYQNDPDFHTPSFASGQFAMPRLALGIRCRTQPCLSSLRT